MATPDTYDTDKEEKDQRLSSTNAENLANDPSPENKNNRSDKLAKSVNELNDLSIAIQVFKNRYDELQKHLDFIDQAIDTRTKELQALGSNTVQNAQGAIENCTVQPDVKSGPNPKPKTEAEGKEKEEEEENELVSLCQTMCSRGLRKYVLSHLSETASLREQVPVALKSAPKPSKLVFECIGRFFLQGSKAYTKDSPMIPARQASVLVLEYYLMSGCVDNEAEEDPSLKKEADSAAVAWRKRLVVEGGLAKASEVDARGLILFIACFGIPVVFRDEDICNLVRVSNAREISHAIRQSQALFKRVSDIADGMIKKGMTVEAVDLAYTFGFEEKLSHQTALTSFLHKYEETWKKAKEDARDCSNMQEADEKYLAALTSVVNCLERHKIDYIKLFPGWQLKDKITVLKKDISDTNKKIEEKSVQKRKVDKSNSSNKKKIPEVKRTRFTMKDPPMASPSVTTLKEQRIVSHMDGNSSYDGLLSAHLLDSRTYGYPTNYPTLAPVQIGSVSGSLTESFLRNTAVNEANVLGGTLAGSSSGYQGDMIRENVGTMLNRNSHVYKWHGIGERALSKSVGHSFEGHPTLYGRTSIESFAGFPDHLSIGATNTNRSGRGSDLYSFADAVFDV
ncbi:protein FRIGIDA isoform X2 [Abrus precatorius]|uniref:FRIGIDA-like protein n=1 Tax=Abrus precatorius TaxID=3816 RepID=A0A8B8JXM1_ABRPR|nr:protein FRIGIDA isoform X2 [Abrus precatorius]